MSEETPERPDEEAAAPTALPTPAVPDVEAESAPAPEAAAVEAVDAEVTAVTDAEPADVAQAVADAVAEAVPDAVADAAPGAGPDAPAAPAKAAEPSPAETAAALAALFPALFGGPGPKPVKLRIQSDIQQRAPGRFTKKTLSIFLHRHTTSTGYLKALVAEGAQRIDLDGQPAGEIDPVHLEAARVELARRWEIVLAKRAAERAGARAAQAPAPATADGERPPRPPRPEGPRPPRPEGTRPPRPEGARPPRPEGPRPPRPEGPRPARPEGSRPPRPEGQQRPPRPDGPRPPRPEGQRSPRPEGQRPLHAGERGPRPERMASDQQRPPQAPRRDGPPAETALPVDPAQRERLMLLRAFESSPLSKANFCALKRLSEADLDRQLAQARQELGPRRG
ncbi:MAG: ProQ/FINO family protein [Rubrivivax sp.]